MTKGIIMKYTLNLEFSDDQLNTIYAANQKVTLVKKIGADQGSVAWITFQPFKSNTVVWDTDYEVYCSPSNLKID